MSPDMQRNRVDLPHPDGPTMHASCPASMENVRSCTATCARSPCPYWWVSPETSSMVDTVGLLRDVSSGGSDSRGSDSGGSDSGGSDIVAPTGLPAEDEPFDREQQCVEQVADRAQHQHPGPHHGIFGVQLRGRKFLADAAAADDLGHDHQ